MRGADAHPPTVIKHQSNMNPSSYIPYSILPSNEEGKSNHDLAVAFPNGDIPFQAPKYPMLHLSYMKERKPSLNVSILNSDPNTETEGAVWITADFRRRKPTIHSSRWIPVVSTYPIRPARYSVRCFNTCQSYADLKVLSAVASEGTLDSVNYIEIFLQRGVKHIRFSHYYYFADELEPGNGLPYRCVSFRNAELPLQEFIGRYLKDHNFVDTLQQEAKQYIEDISKDELLKRVAEDLDTYRVHISINPENTADDYPVGQYSF